MTSEIASKINLLSQEENHDPIPDQRQIPFDFQLNFGFQTFFQFFVFFRGYWWRLESDPILQKDLQYVL